MVKIDHLTLAVRDSKLPRDWYVNHLGFKVEFEVPQGGKSGYGVAAIHDDAGLTVFLEQFEEPKHGRKEAANQSHAAGRAGVDWQIGSGSPLTSDNLLKHAVLDYGHLKDTRLFGGVKTMEEGFIPWAQSQRLRVRSLK